VGQADGLPGPDRLSACPTTLRQDRVEEPSQVIENVRGGRNAISTGQEACPTGLQQ